MSVPRRRLDANELKLLASSRRAVLATIAEDGRPRLVPIAFAYADSAEGQLILYSVLDEKPKSVADPRSLARVKDVLARPRVTVLVDEWSEDWSHLTWLRLDAIATLIEPDSDRDSEHLAALRLLRERYSQYDRHRLETRPVLRIAVERVVGWSAGG